MVELEAQAVPACACNVEESDRAQADARSVTKSVGNFWGRVAWDGYVNPLTAGAERGGSSVL